MAGSPDSVTTGSSRPYRRRKRSDPGLWKRFPGSSLPCMDCCARVPYDRLRCFAIYTFTAVQGIVAAFSRNPCTQALYVDLCSFRRSHIHIVALPNDQGGEKGCGIVPHTTAHFTLSSGMPSASATPLPYAVSAFKQFPMWRILMNSGASPIARAVFSQSTFCCAVLISRKSLPGWV